MTTIALDCMGSDHGAREAVAGAAQLSLERGDIRTILVGDGAELSPLLDGLSYDPAHLSVVHASTFGLSCCSTKVVLKDKADASMVVACRLVAEGRAEAVVTAGNTGAAILAADRSLGRIPGVRRAALAAAEEALAGRVRGLVLGLAAIRVVVCAAGLAPGLAALRGALHT